MPGDVTIPPTHRPVLARLLTLPEAKSAGLVAALQTASPALLIGTVARRLASALEIPEDDMNEMLFMLASMYLTTRATSRTRESFTEAVVESARELSEFRGADIDWGHAQKLLSDLLACDRS